MSICVCGRIKNNSISENLLEDILVDFFPLSKEVIKEKDTNSVTYEGIMNGDDVIFICEKKPPYNVYESDIIKDDYEYTQLIIFDLNKENISNDKYMLIVKFFMYLRGKITSDILVTSDVHNDMCLLREGEVIWSSSLQINYCQDF